MPTSGRRELVLGFIATTSSDLVGLSVHYSTSVGGCTFMGEGCVDTSRQELPVSMEIGLAVL